MQPCTILDKKASISSHLTVFTPSFKSVGSKIGLVVVWFLMVRVLFDIQPIGRDILDPFSKRDNSSISLSLMMFMIQLMVGVPRVTGTLDPKAVEYRDDKGYLIFVIALQPLYLNPDDDIAQGSGKTILPYPFIFRVPSTRLLKGPTSKE